MYLDMFIEEGGLENLAGSYSRSGNDGLMYMYFLCNVFNTC